MEANRENLLRIVRGTIALLLLLFLFYLAAWQSPETNAAFASEVVALSVIGAVAVGIERIIEVYWAFWEWLGNARYPLGSLSQEYRRMVAELDEKLRPMTDESARTLQKVAQVQGWTKTQMSHAKAELETVRTTLADLIPNIRDEKFGDKAAMVLTQIAVLEQKYPELEEITQKAGYAVDSAMNFVDSFKDNPGRRLLSIYFGAILGLVLVWVTGLDLFQALLGTDIVRDGWTGAHLGVALTGLILGLGSSPTHEVIQILKQIKLSRKAENK